MSDDQELDDLIEEYYRLSGESRHPMRTQGLLHDLQRLRDTVNSLKEKRAKSKLH